MKEKNIYAAALRMRNAIEFNRKGLAEAGYRLFEFFPEGCCEYTTLFLGNYLISEGLCDADRITFPQNNYDPTGTESHTWLILDDYLIVDITADQYSEVNEKVIVTDYSKFHSQFEGEKIVSFSVLYKHWSQGNEAERFDKAWKILK